MNSRNIEQREGNSKKLTKKRTFRVPEGTRVLMQLPNPPGEFYEAQIGGKHNQWDGSPSLFETPIAEETVIFVAGSGNQIGKKASQERKHTKKTETKTRGRNVIDIDEVRVELDMRYCEALRKRVEDDPSVKNIENYWGRLWKIQEKRLGIEFSMEPFPGDLSQIEERMLNGEKPMYVPQELQQVGDNFIPGIKFPHEGYKDSDTSQGWFWVEDCSQAPYSSKTEAELEEIFRRDGRRGMNRIQYAALLLDNFMDGRAITIDTKIASRLLGTRNAQGAITAGNEYEGEVLINNIPPSVKLSKIGARSVEPVTPSHPLLTFYNKAR